MKKRNIPFGYQYKDGIVVIDITEAKTLKRIITEYLNGQSLLKISEALNADAVEYMPGTIGWNKARIMRILDDNRYIGSDDLPKLIEDVTFEQIQSMKTAKNNLKETDFTSDIFKLSDKVRCAKCGSVMHRRHDSRIKCADRWTCQNNDCSTLVGIFDSDLLASITEVLNIPILTPGMIVMQKSVGITASNEVMKTENEIGKILDTRGFDIAEAKKKMLECVSHKYNCISKDNLIAERLKAEFEESSPLSTFPPTYSEKQYRRYFLIQTVL